MDMVFNNIKQKREAHELLIWISHHNPLHHFLSLTPLPKTNWSDDETYVILKSRP